MKIFTCLLVAFLSLAGCTSDSSKAVRLNAQVDSLLGVHPGFNGVVLVAEKGRPLVHKAIGYRDFESKALLDTGSVFELASVSKQFTSMIIMMLKEKGKLSYDDPIEKYIPGLPYQGISIRHLLHHTSGLPDYMAVMDAHWNKLRVAGNAEILEYLIQYHPEKRFEPGEKYEYSNTGYVLLASIAEAASGKNFVTLCREQIFRPLAMTSTDIRTPEEKKSVANFAQGYIFVPDRQRYVPADSFPSSNYIVWLGRRMGPGRISATASDLLRWDRALYTEQLVKRETLEEAFTPALLNNRTVSSYGFGWSIRTDSILGRVVYHTGSNPGYSTIIIRYTESDKTIILLCNNSYSGFQKIHEGVDALLATRKR